MATEIKKRQPFKRDQDLFEFGRAYLSAAFPNPERQGCPPDETLRFLASRPTQGDPSITDHVTCCSPCFNAYMAHLANARAGEVQPQRIRHITWIRKSLVTAGVAVMLMIAIYVFFTKRQGGPAATAISVPVLVDLSNASPSRGGDQSDAGPSPQVIPSSPLIDFTLQLPLGSEAREYSVMLSSKQHVVWSDSAQAHLENRQMLLHMHADFTHVRVGIYDLVVVSKGFRLTVPVVVKLTSSGRTQ
jgi:hypothetical protein